MAEGPGIPQTDQRCHFSSTHGCNVRVKGPIAEWDSIDSGGRLFVDRSLDGRADLSFIFEGKGHAEVGLLKENPQFIPDIKGVSKWEKYLPVQTARIYKQTGNTTIRRTNSAVVTESEGKQNVIAVDRQEQIWITVYLVFGDITVNIESLEYKFIDLKGGNIEFFNSFSQAKLRYPNPDAVCFLPNPLNIGEYFIFKVDPQVREGKKSKNYSIKFSVSETIPDSVNFTTESYNDISTLKDVVIQDLPLKSHGQLRIELMENGQLKLNHRNGSNINTSKKFSKVFCIIEICRVTIECVGKKRIVDGNVPDAKLVLEEVQEVRDEISNISLLKSTRSPSCDDQNRTLGYEVQSAAGKETVNERTLHEIVRRLDSIEHNLGQKIENKFSQKELKYLEYTDEIRSLRKDVNKIREDIEKRVILQEQSSNQLTNPQTKHLIQDACDPIRTISSPLKEVLRNKYKDLVNNMEPIALSDHFVQMNKVTMEFHERLRNLHKVDRLEANRELLDKITKSDLTTEEFLTILNDTKQDGVIQIIKK